MFFDYETNRRAAHCARTSSRLILCLGYLCLMVTVVRGESDQFWSFPLNENSRASGDFPILVPLPCVDEAIQNETNTEETNPEETNPEIEALKESFIARLLPPLPITATQTEPHSSALKFPASNPAFDQPKLKIDPIAVVEVASKKAMQPTTAETPELEILSALLQGSSSAATGVLTDSRVNELAKMKIQHAYAMASRNALYVARQELIEVLRMISQAKDAQQGTPERTQALAAGIRALREAEDFAPRGTQLEAELDIGVLCASHRTPVAKLYATAQLLPSLMMDRYLRYAQLKLALSVAGEPAGSMALHALGKINSQLGRFEPAKNRLADRRAIAYQQAALLAHNQNYLAAHELGVLLATSGHFSEAEQLLERVAVAAPNAVVFRNLARVQEKLGQSTVALASREYARQLSQQGVTGTSNVQWVSPNQFARGHTQPARYTTAQRPAINQIAIPGGRRVVPTTHR